MKLVFLSGCLLLLAGLSSCGWQLRGLSNNLSPQGSEERLKALQLTIGNTKGPLADALQEQMMRMKIALNESAKVVLVIEKEQVDKRPLALSDTGVTAQYQLIYTVHYHYQSEQGEALTPKRKVTSWRTYDFDAQLIVSKSLEEAGLLQEMREELSQRILGSTP